MSCDATIARDAGRGCFASAVLGMSTVLAVPSTAAADEATDADSNTEAHRVSVGIEVLEYFPSISPAATPQPHEFGSPQQHTGITEIDAIARIRVQPWLRIVPFVGFTVLSLGFNASFAGGQPDLAGMNQNAIVGGAGAQAFYRYRGWEAHADVQLRAPFAIGGANATFFASSGEYAGELSGGESIAITVGAARRLGPVSLFFDLGYLRSIVSFEASAVGLSASFGGLFVGGGVALW